MKRKCIGNLDVVIGRRPVDVGMSFSFARTHARQSRIVEAGGCKRSVPSSEWQHLRGHRRSCATIATFWPALAHQFGRRTRKCYVRCFRCDRQFQPFLFLAATPTPQSFPYSAASLWPRVSSSYDLLLLSLLLPRSAELNITSAWLIWWLDEVITTNYPLHRCPTDWTTIAAFCLLRFRNHSSKFHVFTVPVLQILTSLLTLHEAICHLLWMSKLTKNSLISINIYLFLHITFGQFCATSPNNFLVIHITIFTA